VRIAALDAFPTRRPVRGEETTAQAVAALDAQFPWLRGTERGGCDQRCSGIVPRAKLQCGAARPTQDSSWAVLSRPKRFSRRHGRKTVQTG
jgi:hypothetical protein